MSARHLQPDLVRSAILCCCCIASVAGTSGTLTRHVEQGTIRGTYSTSSKGVEVAAFKGIPFALPPLGEGRFAPPRPPANWAGVLNTTEFKHNCIQGVMNMGWPQPLSTQSEDCLYLNVYAPAKLPDKPLPVVFWIFGGGFQGGGGNETRLNGTWDVALKQGEVIIVTHSYRLNIFGFLASEELRSRDPEGSTGNYGIQDQRAAMQWTQKNIAAFGGDPRKVFIVGQSAGANSVSQHLARQKSWGLFSSAGLESGAFYDGIQTSTVPSMKPIWDKLVEQIGCSGAKNVTDCVAAAPTKALIDANRGCCGGWSITVDGVDLTAPGPILAAKGALAPVPIIAGSVREDLTFAYSDVVHASDHPPSFLKPPDQFDETAFRGFGLSLGFNSTENNMFVEAYTGPPVNGAPSIPPNATDWYWAYKHAGSDAWATCPARRISQWYRNIGINAWWYYWTHIPDGPNGNGGAHHACEQPFIFHVMFESRAELNDDQGKYHINISNPIEVALSDQIVNFYTSMADSGSPGSNWPLYNNETFPAMIFGDYEPPLSARPAVHVRDSRCDFWDMQFDKVLASWSN